MTKLSRSNALSVPSLVCRAFLIVSVNVSAFAKKREVEKEKIFTPLSSVHCGGCWNGRMDGWMKRWMGGWMGGWMEGWVDRRMDGRMDGWMEGRKEGWMEGWMNE